MPVNATKIPPPTPVVLTTLASANYRSASIANISESPKISIAMTAAHSQSSDTLDADGFVKPQPKGLFLNYFKGSKKDSGRTALESEKRNKSPSPLKWLSSFSPKKTGPIPSVSVDNLFGSRRADGGSDPCLSPLNSDSRRWTFGSSPVNGSLAANLENGKCGNLTNGNCLKAQKSFSCDDNLTDVVEGDCETGVIRKVGSDIDHKFSEPDENTFMSEPVSPGPISKPTGARRHSITGSTDHRLSINLRKLGSSALSSAKGVVGLSNKKRRSSISHGLPIDDKKESPRAVSTSTGLSTNGQVLRNPSSSRLSLPVSTPRTRVSTSPRTRNITPTPKKPPRLSLTGFSSP